ncbi:MAG TPA: site-2 protease family protein [Anaerolineae bacterium]|nr:site-2 protease family protein [Ardenticatenia bacterium]HQZ71661.1 site-2 protease family protein [Anaerolineae bacterium]HRA19199.1 site-2 protease family protein [Anaerolineae bacterium]
MLFGDQSPSELLARIAALVIALTVHEWAHAWSAYKLGDTTARDLGRLTLDPRKHLDPMGSLMMLVAGFGWAKPVPINPERLGRQGVVWVSLAGPVSNLLQALITAGILRLAMAFGVASAAVTAFLGTFLFLNIALAVFNMLPIPPLDGSKVLMGLVDLEYDQRVKYEQYGPMALLLLIFGGSILRLDLLGSIMRPPSVALFNLIARLTGLPTD